MGKVKDLQRAMYNKAAANFLCEQEDGDLYDAYLKLCQVREDGGNNIAANYVVVWQPLEHYTVNGILDLIEGAVEEPQIPEFIKNIDWKLLKQQNNALTLMISSMGNDEDDSNALIGIQSLLDALKDYAVDELGIPESTVFPDEE